MLKKIKLLTKKALRAYASFFRIDLSTRNLRYQNLSVEEELYRHWSEVGGYMRNAMNQIDREIEEDQRLRKKRDDAQMSIDFNEHRKKEDLEHA